jgi:serine protease Do
MNKNIVFSVVFSLLSAFSAVLIYDIYVNPHKVVWEKIEKANFVRENEVLLNGKFNKVFEASKPDDFIETAKKGVESVVFIRTSKKIKAKINDFHPEFYRSSGSGVIISSDGLIVSNHHVIEDAKEIKVVLHDNREFDAEVLGYDSSTDLALLKINADNLPFLFFGNSDSLQVGEWVLAIGSPFRLQSSVTAGIVSAKARNINLLQSNGIESYIQTDAAVNPGNSGGALVNTQGLLVGIIGALMSESGSYEGFSFAIPSTLTQKVIYDIQKFGSVQRGWLGITIYSVNNDLAKENGLESVKGVYVESVSRKSSASDAGVKKGDIIIKVNKSEVNGNADFMELVARHRPGETIQLTLVRQGETMVKQAILKNNMNTYDLISVRRDEALQDLGFELRDMSQKEIDAMGKQGVMVVSVLVGSKMNKINIEPGYIISSVNKNKVGSVDEFIEQYEKSDQEVRFEGFYRNYPGDFPYVFDK